MPARAHDAPRAVPLLAPLRSLWHRLQAENVPRLFAYTTAVIAAGGLLVRHFELPGNPEFARVEDAFWWALVTLTTVGYGDKIPVTTAGRVIAGVIVLFGIGMLGIVTGKIAGVLVERRIKEGRGMSDAHHLKGHCVLLGWKTDMHLLVSDVLASSPELSAERLVLVNSADEVANDPVRGRFPGLVYVRGNITDPIVLQRANVAQAGKVVILADEQAGRTDQEVDARTVMAALTVKSLAPDVYTCAEVLDSQYEEHLRLARCDEVILSREYGRRLLVSATRSAGITHVLHRLLEGGSGGGLDTIEIPPDLVGRTVGELSARLKVRDQVLVGLLENTGRARTIKREALREAQKTANVGTLVDNLRRVKEMEPNRPRLNPPGDHVIAPHTLAIVIGPTTRTA